jgi:hypothetical protein
MKKGKRIFSAGLLKELAGEAKNMEDLNEVIMAIKKG